MTDTELRIALHETARSLAIAKTAAAQGDWVKAEQALLAAQERNNTLLREIGLKLLIEFRDEDAVRGREQRRLRTAAWKKGVAHGATEFRSNPA